MVIAEIGLNHLGEYKLALEYLDVLLDTNVDGIEFQVRDTEFYLNPKKKDLELSYDSYTKLASIIKSKGKNFGVALTDITKIDFFEQIETDFYKIIINDIKNRPLVESLCKTGKKILVSTGLSSDKDIKLFIEWASKYDNIVLNHTQLSNNPVECNLKAIQYMKQRYNVPISYGSHCNNHNVLYMALCFEPSDIMFYVKKDSNVKYPDDSHAILLEDVSDIIDNIKLLSNSVGVGNKEKMDNKLKESK